MKLLFDFLPIVIFFVAFKIKGIYFATAVAIATAILQIGWNYFRKRKVEPMMMVSVGVLVVFGGFTLLLHNEMFVKWKPTILYWIFAGALTIGRIFYRKNLMKAMIGGQLTLPENIWDRLNVLWVSFFMVVGCLNLYVAYHYPTATWVNFKLFGLLGCTVVFLIAQGIFLAPYVSEENPKQDNAG